MFGQPITLPLSITQSLLLRSKRFNLRHRVNDVVYRATFIRCLYENVFRKLFIGIAYADFIGRRFLCHGVACS